MAGFSVITYAICNKNTQKVISEAIESLSEGMTFKGSVATLDDLPENPLDGDLYIIETDKSKAVFFGDKWIEFDHELSLIAGQNIDIELDSEGNTIISALNAKIGIDFTTSTTVGNLESGTHILASDTIADILYRMLSDSAPGSEPVVGSAVVNKAIVS